MIRQAKFGLKFWAVRELIADLKGFNFYLSLNSANLISFILNLPHPRRSYFQPYNHHLSLVQY